MQEYYLSLVKPSFAPPAYLFWPVWTILYIIIAVSFSYIIYKVFTKKISFWIIIPLSINLVSNLIYTPLMFIYKNTFLATVDIFFVLLTIIWMMILTYKKDKYFMFAQIPYLLWVSFASILQVSVLLNN